MKISAAHANRAKVSFYMADGRLLPRCRAAVRTGSRPRGAPIAHDEKHIRAQSAIFDMMR
jgi:hypothetical protein